MIRLCVFLAATVIPASAQALSCLPWGVTDAYLEAAASDDPYLVVAGKLSFDEGLLPVTDWERQQETPPLTAIPARLEGKSLTSHGFSQVFGGDLLLEIGCAGPWCAGAKSGVDYVAFVELRGETGVVTVGPCGGNLFDASSPEVTQQVLSCHKGNVCKPLAGEN